MGDLNACIKILEGTNECGREMDESLLKFKGIVLNPPNKPTFYRHTDGILRSTSTLDLIISDEKPAKSLASFDSLKLSPVYDLSIKNSKQIFSDLKIKVFIEYWLASLIMG